MHMTVRTTTYKVGITFCMDDVVFVHDHEDASSACAEYAQMLLEAIEPSASAPEARHIRMVSLVGFNDSGFPTLHFNTPIFPCKHNRKEPA
jgi:hypothetical protein